jgi:hypothetical protein
MLKTLFHPSLAGLRRLAQGFATFNASADDLALRCFVLRVGEQFATASPFNAMLRRCSLTLDGLFEFTHCCAPSNACCACTHYLVFKEPECRRRVSRRRSPPIGIFRRFQGNLLRLLPATTLVKPFFIGEFEGMRLGHPPASVTVSRPTRHYRAGARQANLPRLRCPPRTVNATADIFSGLWRRRTGN